MYCKQQSLHAVQNSRYEYGGSSRGLSGYNRPEAATQRDALMDIGVRSFQPKRDRLSRMQ
jgi:hypothetical protein